MVILIRKRLKSDKGEFGIKKGLRKLINESLKNKALPGRDIAVLFPLTVLMRLVPLPMA